MKPLFGISWVSFCLLALAVVAPTLHAHPVVNLNHNRTISIQLGVDRDSGNLRIRVHYTLEMLETTGLSTDAQELCGMKPLDFRNRRQEFWQECTTRLGPMLARRIQAAVDAETISLTVEPGRYSLADQGQDKLVHFEFVFTGVAPLSTDAEHSFTFHEGNYLADRDGRPDRGQISIALKAGRSLALLDSKEPAAALMTSPPEDVDDADYASLRDVSARFRLSGQPEATAEPTVNSASKDKSGDDTASLVRLFMGSRRGIVITCLLAFVLGAFHALTPGHGKTLVAAYLVGEHGTIWHACLLGLTTTLTHTGAVLALAVGFQFMHPSMQREMEKTLGVVMGLLIAGLGFWLLLRRLGGGADHIHIGGHAHSHPHGAHDHKHDHVHVHTLSAGVSWPALILLGVQGGLVPCWDAVVMLLTAISMNLLWLALPMLLAFSAGLAVVLVTIGVLVVCAKGFAGSHWGESRLFRALPLLSAVVVTVLGLVLCYQALHT